MLNRYSTRDCEITTLFMRYHLHYCSTSDIGLFCYTDVLLGTFSCSMVCSFWYTLHGKVVKSLVDNELEWMSQKLLWPYFRSWRKQLKISVRFASFQTGISQMWNRVVNQLTAVLVAMFSKFDWCILWQVLYPKVGWPCMD